MAKPAGAPAARVYGLAAAGFTPDVVMLIVVTSTGVSSLSLMVNEVAPSAAEVCNSMVLGGELLL